jgi:hypothetical protein
MAFLKETERSLRIYFVLVGIVGTLAGVVWVDAAASGRYSGVSAVATLTIWLMAVSPLVIGPAFVIAGIRLKQSLQTGARGTKRLVAIAAAVIVVEIVLLGAAVSSAGGDAAEQAGRATGRALIPLLILWYIHASLRRLARESQRRIVETVADKFV